MKTNCSFLADLVLGLFEVRPNLSLTAGSQLTCRMPKPRKLRHFEICTCSPDCNQGTLYVFTICQRNQKLAWHCLSHFVLWVHTKNGRPKNGSRVNIPNSAIDLQARLAVAVKYAGRTTSQWVYGTSDKSDLAVDMFEMRELCQCPFLCRSAFGRECF